MDFVVDKKYLLIVEGIDRNLTYNCTIIKVDDDSITFVDRLGKILSYRKDKIISTEEK